MRNKLCMRTLALMLTLVMVFGLCPAASAAPVQTAPSAAEDYKTIAEYLEEQKTVFDQAASEQEVSFIVELEEPSMADSIPEGMKLSDFLDTAKGNVRLSAIEQQQTVMAAAIERCADDIAITHRYRVVLNGFAVKASYGDRAALEALDGVKRVTLGNVYSVPEPQAAEGEVITSGEMINSDSVNAEGYTGKGTFAAIVDTGLNVGHEAFVGASVKGAVVTADTIAALDGLNASGDLYKNAKVAFAYDYADEDDDVSDSMGHGTHVAGTVGANGTSFKGVAPDAQLAIMKVFGDSGGAYDSDIFAALEDCVILGVDTVNMSLGMPCGFTYEDDATDAVYNAVRNAGINLMVSAGNENSSAFQNLHGTDLPLASNPDYGIVGSPSTYAAALSIASVNESLAYASYFLLGDEQISYDENPDSYYTFAELENEYEYVCVPGVGSASDFKEVEADVIEKIALVERGGIDFAEKESNAASFGAIAMIVYNNSDVDETVYMQLDGQLPAVFISKAEGDLMKKATNKTITISPDYVDRLPSPTAGQMSDFSSMGVTPDLRLKPELTAPGGNVLSTSASGGYVEMSGTSMAAPHMTGAAAVMRQYVNTAFPTLSDSEKQALIDNLLLSTAVPVLDKNSVAYSPRKQGAGLANVSAAIHSEAYLTINGGKPIASLGENEDGTYSFTFTVHNLSDSEKTWNVALDAIIAQTEELSGKTYISELCRSMKSDELNVTFSSETVTVAPGQTADVKVTLALTATGKQNLAAFLNGIYVEGFVRLTGDDAPSLGLPYLGFYGDWADAPIFDTTMYDEEASFMAESSMAMMDYNGSGNYLGVNAITGNAKAEWIAYPSRNADYQLPTPITGLLRAPKEIQYTAAHADTPDENVYTLGYSNAFKSFYYSSGGYIYTDFVSWDDSWQAIGVDDNGEYYYLEDGQYIYTIKARIDGEEEFQSLEYPICIDNQAPQILSHTYEVIDGTPYLTIKVTDNHYVMAAQLADEGFTTALSPIIAVEETEAGAVTTLTFDLTEAQADGYETCRLDLYDYAWNELLSAPISTTVPDIQLEAVQLDPQTISVSANASNMELHATVSPDNAVNQTLTWSSTNERVAKIVTVSTDTLTAKIDFVGEGTCEIRATAANGVYGSAAVTVSPAEEGAPDASALEEAVTSAGALNEEDYTPETWAAVEDALAEAEAVLADSTATQEQIDAALEALEQAIAGLTNRADFSKLNAAIEACKTLSSASYTPDSWAALQAALKTAKAVAADLNATQQEVNAALKALEQATAGLTKRADFSKLNAAIKACQTLKRDSYTSDSWAALQAALKTAKAVAADLNATQKEVNAALNALTAAKNGLVLRGDSAKLTQLVNEVTAEYNRLAVAVFPAKLIDALEDALANAKAGLADVDSTQKELDDLYTALNRAWKAVKSYPVNGMYSDVPKKAWYYGAVDFVTRYGFMNGMGDGRFSPESNVSRAQFVVVLYRLAGSPDVTVKNRFVDVPANTWFTDAVLWAYQNGITTGVDATHFNPNGSLIRQNMVTFLLRFAKTMGIDTSAQADLSGYTDAKKIVPYARDAMEWAVAEGIISGMSATTLGPNGLANRAQIATIIQRLVINYFW